MWTRVNIKQIIIDLSLKVTGQPFTGDSSFYQLTDADWKDTLGLDSIELMGLAAAVNSFFNIFEIYNPPYLLSSTRIDDWVDMIYKVRQVNDEALIFHTSGTSGTAKITRHPLAYLEREIAFLGTLFSDATCIVPYVASNSIYGFLFTVGLPRLLNIPVVYPSQVNWQQMPPQALIVATPFNWQFLLNTLPGAQMNCLGVSAAAPLYDILYQDILSKGISLTELYGSTETSGIGFRTHWEQPFTLLPFWEFTAGNNVADRDGRAEFELMDEIDQLGPGKFKVTGRRDKQVKVAGKLVDMEAVTAQIKKMPNIAGCRLSAKALGNDVIIQAELALVDDGEQQRAEIKKLIRTSLPAHEKPRDLYFS
ncbi:hypothetical protein [Mucilaginibacter glaciei]|uniref:Uncharacterized protein n=1 Tax=Mucilaginibacter glaciei TaxID=2772109 RepID=A0A926NV42_9SPHI|nr:hypothetical protein [Mucilaginibacter glaciei]MBD1395255.1 hypothetical protein [Mucilaginibacter glaciei]